jgi:DNA-binding response OmpR family regulator
MTRRIDIISKDRKLINHFKNCLESERYKIYSHSSPSEVIGKTSVTDEVTILFDWEISKLSPGRYIYRLLNYNPATKIIVISSKVNGPEEESLAFKMGVDDYIERIANCSVLKARLENLFDNSTAAEKVIYEDIVLDTKTKTVDICDKRVDITPKEYDVLKLLLINRDRVVTRKVFDKEIWSEKSLDDSRLVDHYVGRLRELLSEADSNVEIKTRRGFGYILESNNKQKDRG